MMPSAVSDAVARTRQLDLRREVVQQCVVALAGGGSDGDGSSRLGRFAAALVGAAAGFVRRLLRPRRTAGTQVSE
jgi:hypothetical protein